MVCDRLHMVAAITSHRPCHEPGKSYVCTMGCVIAVWEGAVGARHLGLLLERSIVDACLSRRGGGCVGTRYSPVTLWR